MAPALFAVILLAVLDALGFIFMAKVTFSSNPNVRNIRRSTKALLFVAAALQVSVMFSAFSIVTSRRTLADEVDDLNVQISNLQNHIKEHNALEPYYMFQIKEQARIIEEMKYDIQSLQHEKCNFKKSFSELFSSQHKKAKFAETKESVNGSSNSQEQSKHQKTRKHPVADHILKMLRLPKMKALKISLPWKNFKKVQVQHNDGWKL